MGARIPMSSGYGHGRRVRYLEDEYEAPVGLVAKSDLPPVRAGAGFVGGVMTGPFAIRRRRGWKAGSTAGSKIGPVSGREYSRAGLRAVNAGGATSTGAALYYGGSKVKQRRQVEKMLPAIGAARVIRAYTSTQRQRDNRRTTLEGGGSPFGGVGRFARKHPFVTGFGATLIAIGHSRGETVRQG